MCGDMTGTQSPLRRQLRVLHALMMREMITRYGRTSLGYVWALVEPVGFIALLSLLFIQIAHAPPIGKSFPLFYASGYVAFHLVTDIANVTGRSIHVNRPLLAFPAVTPLDTVLARFFLQSLTGLCVALVIFVGILILETPDLSLNPGPLLAAFCLAAALGLGIGLFNTWAFARWRAWELIWGVISRPLFLISCVFFNFQSLPATARDILWWNPVVHVVGLMRSGIYGAYDSAHVRPDYVLALAATLAMIGLWGMRGDASRLIQA